MTDGFEKSNIQHQLPYHSEWEIPALSEVESEKLKQILNQPYTYIGKGAQSYAFASADDKYVLKFFKYKHLVPNAAVQFLPNWPKFITKWKNRYYDHKNYRLQTLFDGHFLAYTKDKDFSAIDYIHLNTDGKDLPSVTLIDRLGRNHTIELGKTAFILQKKGITARNLLNAQLKDNDVSAAWGTIRDMLVMLIMEYNQGIYDRDHGVLHNTGFVEGRPFHLDVGKLTDEPTMKTLPAQADDLHKVVHRILPWVHRNYPQHETVIKQRMEEMLSVYLEKEFQI